MTHSNNTNTTKQTILTPDEVVELTVQKLKETDTEKIIDFENYSFSTYYSKTNDWILEVNNRGVENGKVRFTGYLNCSKLDEVDEKTIEKAVLIGYRKIQKEWEKHQKKLERQSKYRWTLDDVRKIMEELDEETGMEGQEVPCKISKAKRKLAHFKYDRWGDPVEFAFTEQLLTYATYEELLDTVIHEYCHYWQVMLEGKSGHNKEFKTLCQKLGGSGSTCFAGFSELDGGFPE